MKKPKIPPKATPTVEIPKGIKGREQYIEHLVKKYNFKIGAELGVWKGRTFLHLLKTCPSIELLYGIDLWESQPDNQGPEDYMDWPHRENENYVREQAKKFNEKAVVIKDWTTNAANLVDDNTLDFVFIDADHSSESVKQDLDCWIPKIKQSGMIIGHDYNWETVRVVADAYFNEIKVGPDNLWFDWKENKKG